MVCAVCPPCAGSQIDEARSRVDEVKALVRTAIAHHFVSMLQDRLYGRFRMLFVRWSLATGVQDSTQAKRPAFQAHPVSSTGIDGAPLVAPGPQNLSRFPLALRTNSHCSLIPGRDVAAPGTDGVSDISSGQLAALSPVWLRPSLRALEVGKVSFFAGTAGSASLRRTRAVSFAGHEPEELLAERGSGRVVEYRVKWKGFSSARSATWELGSQVRMLSGFEEALRRWTSMLTRVKLTLI